MYISSCLEDGDKLTLMRPVTRFVNKNATKTDLLSKNMTSMQNIKG